MANIFDRAIRLAYSGDLHKHLKGLDPSTCDYSGTSIYTWTIFIMIPTSLFIILNFYYGFFNRPKFSNRAVWALNVLLACLITFLSAYLRPDGDLRNNNYCESLRFNYVDCALFGFTAAMYSLVLCVTLSFLMKWWSLHNKKNPF